MEIDESVIDPCLCGKYPTLDVRDYDLIHIFTCKCGRKLAVKGYPEDCYSLWNDLNKLKFSVEHPITPIPKPRMTQRDRWKKRPIVLKYHAFKDELRLRKFTLPESGYHIIFVLPMPKSWSKKKRAEMDGKPHQQKPDKDNLEKAVLDAIFEDDSHIWDGRASKIWGYEGKIIVRTIQEG